MPHDLDWDGCLNVRDLGGFPTSSGMTRFGVFVRADNARKLTPTGWQAARDYGIETVLDLRSEPECAADPPPQPDFEHVRLSLFDHFDGDEEYRADFIARVDGLDLAGRYRTFYREALELDAARFADAVAVLAGASGGTLFHCVGGKDRTGVLAALLLRLVGVAVDAIDADYVYSEERLLAGGGAPGHGTATSRGVIDRVLDELEERYGTVEAYLAHAGVPAAQLERIRLKL